MANDPAERRRWGPLTVILLAVGAIVIAGALSYLMHLRSVELARTLDSADPTIVIDGLTALTDRGDPAGIEKATMLLKSDNQDVRLNAALYLGKLGKSDSVPYLIDEMSDVEDYRQNEIISDLMEITGKSFGQNVAAWRSWWVSTHPQNPFHFGNHPDTEP
ncbi:MAG TPA: HEAT repeat domain-containing protein [Tepidisphaeraceae bacterium]|jgi:hypothetical protein|nr:HEAT repeat domain-containing protein [Tepidisphaeraceae bacterium]